jgi:hypothetical protein
MPHINLRRLTLRISLGLALCFALPSFAPTHDAFALGTEASYKQLLAELTQRHTQVQKADTDNHLGPQLLEVQKWLQDANFLLGKGELDRLDGILRKTEAYLDLYDVQLQYEVAKASADTKQASADDLLKRYNDLNSQLTMLNQKIQSAQQTTP